MLKKLINHISLFHMINNRMRTIHRPHFLSSLQKKWFVEDKSLRKKIEMLLFFTIVYLITSIDEKYGYNWTSFSFFQKVRHQTEENINISNHLFYYFAILTVMIFWIFFTLVYDNLPQPKKKSLKKAILTEF